jgi:hypothetical protein
MTFWVGLIIGVFVGVMIGVVVMCMIVLGSEADERMRK